MGKPIQLEEPQRSDDNVKKKSNSNPARDANPDTQLHAQESDLQSPPSIVIPDVADMIKFGMKNLLAIAAATEINFEEAKTMKTALAETEPMLAKNERGHVTGAQSTLHPLTKWPFAF